MAKIPLVQPFRIRALRFRPVRTLDVYFFKQFLTFFLYLTVVFMVFVVGNFVLFTLINVILEKNLSARDAGRIILYQSPDFLVYAFPLAALTATLLCVSRMSKDSEMDVIRTSGVSFYRAYLPFVFLGALVSGGSYLLMERVVPAAHGKSREIWDRAVKAGPGADVLTDVYLEGERGTHYIFSALDKKNKTASRVSVYDPGGASGTEQINARAATWKNNALELYDGSVRRPGSKGGFAEESRFDKMALRMDPVLNQLFEKNRASQELTLKELGDRIELERKGGIDTSNVETDFHFKISRTMAGFICVLIAFPLSVRTGRSGMFAGLVFCLLLIAGYYVGMIGFHALGQKGAISPVLAAWLQNLIFMGLAAGLTLFSRK